MKDGRRYNISIYNNGKVETVKVTHKELVKTLKNKELAEMVMVVEILPNF